MDWSFGVFKFQCLLRLLAALLAGKRGLGVLAATAGNLGGMAWRRAKSGLDSKKAVLFSHSESEQICYLRNVPTSYSRNLSNLVIWSETD